MTIITNLWIFQRYGVRYGMSEIAVWSFLSSVLLITFYLYVTIKVIHNSCLQDTLIVLIGRFKDMRKPIITCPFDSYVLKCKCWTIVINKIKMDNRFMVKAWKRFWSFRQVHKTWHSCSLYIVLQLKIFFSNLSFLCRFVYRMHHFQHSCPWNAWEH